MHARHRRRNSTAALLVLAVFAGRLLFPTLQHSHAGTDPFHHHLVLGGSEADRTAALAAHHHGDHHHHHHHHHHHDASDPLGTFGSEAASMPDGVVVVSIASGIGSPGVLLVGSVGPMLIPAQVSGGALARSHAPVPGVERHPPPAAPSAPDDPPPRRSSSL